MPMKTGPSWEDFCGRINSTWPGIAPDNKDSKWLNLYTVYEIGFGAALEMVEQELSREASQLEGTK